MEKKGLVLLAGDEIARNITANICERFDERYDKKEYDLRVMSIAEDRQRIADLSQNIKTTISQNDPIAVVLSIGHEDVLNKTKTMEFEKVLSDLCEYLKQKKIRVVLMTIPPIPGFGSAVRSFNKSIKCVSAVYNFRVADVYTYWRRYLGKKYKKSEWNQFNQKEKDVIIQAVSPILEKTQMLVLWQFNGRYAQCNYSCPYCYVATSVNKGMHFQYDIEKWEAAFSRHFDDTHVVFYLSYGEPMTASKFYDVIDMVGRHPNWEVKITSNVSVKLDKLLSSRVAQEGRLHVNTSFHPTQISLGKFIDKCDQLREHNIEPSIVYVMYPKQIDDFESKYLPAFREKGYRVHIRAFRGLYRGKKYPGAYTKEEWAKTAKYMDSGNLKYQLGEVNGLGRLSMLGVTHILVDNNGKIEMCDSYVGDRHYGNIFDDALRLDLEPKPFPGLVPLAAVDDIADYVELDYMDLTGNNVNNYITQGQVTVTEEGEIVYPYEHVDFRNDAVRNEIMSVPKPFTPAWKFWLNPRWFVFHFVYSYVIKKYGKWGLAWIKGKIRLARRGKLTKENFWHG